MQNINIPSAAQFSVSDSIAVTSDSEFIQIAYTSSYVRSHGSLYRLIPVTVDEIDSLIAALAAAKQHSRLVSQKPEGPDPIQPVQGELNQAVYGLNVFIPESECP